MEDIRKIETWIVEIFYIFILPIALLYFNILHEEWRVPLLLGASIIIYGIVKHNNWSREKLGINKTKKSELIAYGIFSVIGVIVIIYFAKVLNFEPAKDWWRDYDFLIWFIPLSFFQEFIYRGFLMPLLRDMFGRAILVILANALLFALLHVIYPFPMLMFWISFVGGLGFATMYYKYPNLLLVSIAHSILNFTAVLYGFFSFENLLK